jgi:hypothetical protein
MDLSRRKFLVGTAMAGGYLSIPSKNIFAYANAHFLEPGFVGAAAICQGMTNSSSAQFTVLMDERKPHAVRFLKASGEVLPSQQLRREARSYSKMAVERFLVTGLELNQNYRLQVIEEATGLIFDERNFRALDLNRTQISFALVSCANDLYKNQSVSMWNVLAQQKPEMIFFIGDTVYADNESDGTGDHAGGEENFWKRYVDAFTRLGLYRKKDLVPTMATWDDHDFGANDGDSSFREKDITQFLFQLYWGNEPVEGLINGPGISKILKFGGQNFFFTDNRSFRAVDYWGASQSEFLLRSMAEDPRPTWMLDGSQFFGGYRKQPTLENKWPKSLEGILHELKKAESPVLFASGDIHYSEVMRLEASLLGYPTYEFTSSSIHSYTAPGQHLLYRNSRRLVANSDHNFLMFETQRAQGQILTGKCKCITGRGQAFSQNISLSR